jgi:hypothetical protein
MRFMGMMHSRKTVGVSHKPVSFLSLELNLAREGERKSPRFMGMMHGRKAVAASHEPPPRIRRESRTTPPAPSATSRLFLLDVEPLGLGLGLGLVFGLLDRATR